MGHFSLEVIERQGEKRRRAMTAEDYDELTRKLAEKSGLALDDEQIPEVPFDGQ